MSDDNEPSLHTTLLSKSESYRMVLKSRAHQLHQQNQADEAQRWTIAELVWHLAEIFYLSEPSKVNENFYDWYRKNFNADQQTYEEIAEQEQPQQHEDFWTEVYR
jgi:hypothetical protein